MSTVKCPQDAVGGLASMSGKELMDHRLEAGATPRHHVPWLSEGPDDTRRVRLGTPVAVPRLGAAIGAHQKGWDRKPLDPSPIILKGGSSVVSSAANLRSATATTKSRNATDAKEHQGSGLGRHVDRKLLASD